jgi:septum formation protein
LLVSEFEVVPSDVDESVRTDETAESLVRRLSSEKAAAVQIIHPTASILAADTIVVCEDQILGKPASAQEASSMLRSISGRSHEVLTGVCMAHSGQYWSDVCITRVQFSALSTAEINAYVASGEPLDKAGAYGIQGTGARFIDRIEGCYFNVVGLPVSLVYRMMLKSGYTPNGQSHS